MAWDRRLPEEAQAPAPPSIARWLSALLVAVLIGALLFLLYAAVPALAMINVWMLVAAPPLATVLVFALRAYRYGGALGQFEYQQTMAHDARQTWQAWGQRGVAVLASSVLLPDQVSAQALSQSGQAFVSRSGQTRRLAGLPAGNNERLQAALEKVLAGLTSTLKALPGNTSLGVTLLTDLHADRYPELNAIWLRSWAGLNALPEPVSMTLASELPLQWIEDRLKNASSAVELVIVLQVCGQGSYSDGLAGVLLCTDALAAKHQLSFVTSWLRPMPLEIEALEEEFALFLQTQCRAREATGLLADKADWKPLMGRLLTAGKDDISVGATEQWVAEAFSGIPGPCAHWLAAALGVEMVRHRQQPLMLLTQERAQHWISTITTREWV
jgi:hypothetical protein